MDAALLSRRLWGGFARLQVLLGGYAGGGAVVEEPGIVASIVPVAPESPTLNAIVAIDPAQALGAVTTLQHNYEKVGVRRWGVWIDGGANDVVEDLQNAGFGITQSSPGMAAALHTLELGAADLDGAGPADYATVGRVNDAAYGNPDHRLERTLAPLPNGLLHAYGAPSPGRAAAVALMLHHRGDAGVSFVATVPEERRKGHATTVMRRALHDARENGCTTTSLQATEAGEHLYLALGYERLCDMQLWERRA